MRRQNATCFCEKKGYLFHVMEQASEHNRVPRASAQRGAATIRANEINPRGRAMTTHLVHGFPECTAVNIDADDLCGGQRLRCLQDKPSTAAAHIRKTMAGQGSELREQN